MREAVGAFDDIHSLNEAVAELEVTAFPRHDISVRDGRAAKLHPHVITTVYEEDDPETPRTILVRPEEKAIGASVIVGGGFYAGVVTGMLVAGLEAPFLVVFGYGMLGGIFGMVLGALVAGLLGNYYNGVLRRQISEDRMFLWVRTPGPDEERLACEIMEKHGAHRVHINDIH